MVEKITTHDFIYTFCDITKNPDRRFCFVLGAGASKSSGIRTGGELAKEWLREIKERMKNRPDDYQTFLHEKGIDEDNPAAHYPEVYQERFRIDRTSGFDYINKEMEDAAPGYGYSVLAQILAEKQHNIVVTTNFDNLTEEALYTYTSKRPLVCGHESLVSFAKPSLNRPLIVKIHRDRYFNPQSQPEEVGELNPLWADTLNQIFQNAVPVFIGYGGNDGSLMDYLMQIPSFANLFWCERIGNPLSEKVEKLLTDKKGKLVEIEGFDELMFLLQDSLGLDLLDKEITTIANQRAQRYRDTIQEIQKKQASSENTDVQKAAERLVEKAGDDWWSWELKAQAAKTNEEKEKIYKEALQESPNSWELNSNYANFLKDYNGQYDKAEQYYKQALALAPNGVITNGNYAVFLSIIREEHDEAERYYKKVLELHPENVPNIQNYANFLRDVRKAYDDADKYYRKVLELEPNNAGYNGSYALFLQNNRKLYRKAADYYSKAIELAPTDANEIANYSGLLFIMGDIKTATKYFELAMSYCRNDIIKAELCFYHYAHIELNRDQLLVELKKLLCNHIRSINFNLQDHVDRAAKDGHPNVGLLQRLADILTKDAPMEDLCEGIEK